MQWLKDFINGFFSHLYSGLLWLLEGLIQAISYFLYTLYDGFLLIILSIFQSIDLSELAFDMAAQYAGLPPQLIWLINTVDLPQFFAYIVFGIVIRMLLNFVPAALTRI